MSQERRHAAVDAVIGKSLPMHRALLNCQVALANSRPQLAPVILHLKFVEDTALPTMAVDENGLVHVNPSYIAGMAPANLSECILHESLHLFLDYFGRQEKRESLKWNVAHDLEISNYAMPAGCLTPDTFKLPSGRGAEYYYEKLPSVAVTCASGCSQRDLQGAGDLDANESTIRALVRTAEKIVSDSRENEAGTNSSLLRQALKIICPGRANNTLRALQGSMLVPGLSDVSYERPNRRTAGHMNVILPASMHREPNVLLFLDVSGSMTARLERAAHIVMSAVKSIGTQLTVVAWDTKPICVQNVRSANDLKKLKISGGGTDMAAAIISTPTYGHFDSVLVVTDGDTPWPSQAQVRRLPPIHILLVQESPVPPFLARVRL